MKNFFRILLIASLIIGCCKELPDPDVELKGSVAGDLVLNDVVSLIEARSDTVRKKAPGGLIQDTVKFGDPRLVYGLFPANMDIETELTFRYTFHHDTLTRILFRDDTTTRSFQLAKELSIFTDATVDLDSSRHYVALESYKEYDDLREFSSADSLWMFIELDSILTDDIVVLASIYKDSSRILAISYAGNETDLTTGQVRLLDSLDLYSTRGPYAFIKEFQLLYNELLK